MYSGTCLLWSPMGPHVQWYLSNVVTYETSYSWLDYAGGCIIKVEMYVKTWSICTLGLDKCDRFRQVVVLERWLFIQPRCSKYTGVCRT